MMEYLPEDLWIQIFVRLPAKTILRCLSVCKSWKLFIQQPSFINAHLQHQRQDLMLLKNVSEFGLEPDDDIDFGDNLRLVEKSEVYSLHIDDESFSMHASYELPAPYGSGYFSRVVGSCNGIICITDDFFWESHDTYLWNPTIRKCINLPGPMFTFDKVGRFSHELGFGFDEKTNDFKVVRIVDPLDSDDMSLEVEIYSLSIGIWRKASHLASNLGVRIIFSSHFYERDRQVYLNGAVHWLCHNRERNSFMVIVFLLGEEVFHCFEPPSDIKRDFFSIIRLQPKVIQGDFSLIQYSEQRCSIWVLKNYGASSTWSKHLDINLFGHVQRVVGIRKKGELLIEIPGILYSYDPEAMRGKQFNFFDEEDLLYWRRLKEYYELDQFYFEDRVRNYEPEAAPKELFTICRKEYSHRLELQYDRYVESLALIGSTNSVKSREEESERIHEEGNSISGLTAELQHLGEEVDIKMDKL